jgi:hypothetical protein
MIQDFGELLKDFKQMAQELGETTQPEPNPEPAEGQVPAGEFVPVPEPEPEPEQVAASQEKSINEVAKEVLAGKWGRGQIRKKRLQDAGFDVAAVSEEITRILNQ